MGALARALIWARHLLTGSSVHWLLIQLIFIYGNSWFYKMRTGRLCSLKQLLSRAESGFFRVSPRTVRCLQPACAASYLISAAYIWVVIMRPFLSLISADSPIAQQNFTRSGSQPARATVQMQRYFWLSSRPLTWRCDIKAPKCLTAVMRPTFALALAGTQRMKYSLQHRNAANLSARNVCRSSSLNKGSVEGAQKGSSSQVRG